MGKVGRLTVAAMVAASSLLVASPAQAQSVDCRLLAPPVIVPGYFSLTVAGGVGTYPGPATGACVSSGVGVYDVGVGAGAEAAVGDALYAKQVQGGTYVCRVTFCVLVGASVTQSGTGLPQPYAGVCYVDLVQAKCVDTSLPPGGQ